MNILLTSVGRRTYIIEYFKKALAKSGIIHAANSIYTYSMKVADKSVITPLIYDDCYINFLLNYCINNDINVIIPLFDIDLAILAKNKKKFEENNVIVLVSNFDFVEICNDKWMTYKYLINLNLHTPHTFIKIEDTLTALKNGIIKYPLIIKPRWGMGSIGIFEAENENELEVLYKKTFYCIKNSYLKFESNQDLQNCVVIQEKIDGEEFGLDLLNDLCGNYLTCIPKKKLAMRAGETDIAEIVDKKELVLIGKSLSTYTKHIGNLDIDCIYSNEKYYIIEMNCRFGGQYPFTHLAGANFPKVLIDLINTNSYDKSLLNVKYGTIGYKDIKPVK